MRLSGEAKRKEEKQQKETEAKEKHEYRQPKTKHKMLEINVMISETAQM